MKKLIKHKPFSYFVNTKFYNSYYKNNIKKKVEKLVVSPIFVNIETTNACNADCLMCPHKIMKRKIGAMDMEIFKKITDSVVNSEFEINQFVLSGFGEPFLDKLIFDRIKYIKSKGKYYTKLFTNASLMDEEKSKKIIDSGIDELQISFNAISRKVYEKVMGKINFEESMKNINTLINLRKGIKTETLKIVLSCMKLEENKEEVSKVRFFWKGKVDQVLKPVPENWSGNLHIKSPFKFRFKKVMWPCRGMWDTIDFLWDGKVSLCCRDYEGKQILGDIGRDTVKELVEKKREIGYKQLSGDFSLTPICYNCDTIINNAVSWW